MSKKTIVAAVVIATILTSAASARDGIEIIQPSNESKAVEVAIGAGIGVGAGVSATAAALSAAGIAAVPHVAGGMILISTATGSSYIAGTLGLVGGAAACVASVACAVVVVGGAAIAVGGGYYAYEAFKSKEIEYNDVIIAYKEISHKGSRYLRIKDKFVTPKKRSELNNIATNDEFNSDRYLSDGLLLHWGLVNDNYYVSLNIAQQLEAQFNSGGLYEVDLNDEKN